MSADTHSVLTMFTSDTISILAMSMLMTTSTGGPLKIGGKKLNPILTVTRYVKWVVLTVVALPTHAYRPAFTDRKINVFTQIG